MHKDERTVSQATSAVSPSI